MKDIKNTVAQASRIEIDNKNNDIYIVFKVTDEHFKNTIRELWAIADIPLILVGDKKTALTIDKRK